jgi:uncharacterized membrane protein
MSNHLSVLALILLCGQLALAAPALAVSYTFTNFNDPAAASQTTASGINDSSQVSGTFDIPLGGGFEGFVKTGASFDNFLFTDGNSHFSTFARGMNNGGQVTGFYFDFSNITHGFVKTGSSFASFDDPSATIGTFAAGINTSGQVVGSYVDNPSQISHGFIKTGNTFENFDFPPTPGLSSTFANAINNLGQVAGYYTDISGDDFAFVKTGKSFATIDGPPGTFTSAFGINDLGQVSGSYFDPVTFTNHGFVETGGSLATLDDPFPGVVSTYVQGINNLGQVTGFATDQFGAFLVSFVATPSTGPSEVPEPGTIFLMIPALLGLVAFGKKLRTA